MTGILGKYLAGKQGGPERKDRLLAQLERLQQVKAAQQEREQAKALQKAGNVLQYTDSWLRDVNSRRNASDAEVNTHLKLRNEAGGILGVPSMETAPDPEGDLMQEDFMKVQQDAWKTADAMGDLWTLDSRDAAIRATSDFMLTKYPKRWPKFLLDAHNKRVADQGATQQAGPGPDTRFTQAGGPAPALEPIGPFDPHQIGYETFAPYFPNPLGKKPMTVGEALDLTKATPGAAAAVGEATGRPEAAALGGTQPSPPGALKTPPQWLAEAAAKKKPEERRQAEEQMGLQPGALDALVGLPSPFQEWMSRIAPGRTKWQELTNPHNRRVGQLISDFTYDPDAAEKQAVAEEARLRTEARGLRAEGRATRAEERAIRGEAREEVRFQERGGEGKPPAKPTQDQINKATLDMASYWNLMDAPSKDDLKKTMWDVMTPKQHHTSRYMAENGAGVLARAGRLPPHPFSGAPANPGAWVGVDQEIILEWFPQMRLTTGAPKVGAGTAAKRAQLDKAGL